MFSSFHAVAALMLEQKEKLYYDIMVGRMAQDVGIVALKVSL